MSVMHLRREFGVGRKGDNAIGEFSKRNFKYTERRLDLETDSYLRLQIPAGGFLCEQMEVQGSRSEF